MEDKKIKVKKEKKVTKKKQPKVLNKKENNDKGNGIKIVKIERKPLIIEIDEDKKS